MTTEIVLDTETTGIDHRKGHRLIEIGCIEIEDLLPTGRTFHRFIDPEREIEPDAIRVHGITNEMVRGKPKFPAICEELLAFIGDNKIIAHNAQFDRGFINMELERHGRQATAAEQWIDTLEIARHRFPGMPNSLDALCKRFNISLAERDLHGALIDARLLASVYLELLGGKERGPRPGHVEHAARRSCKRRRSSPMASGRGPWLRGSPRSKRRRMRRSSPST